LNTKERVTSVFSYRMFWMTSQRLPVRRGADVGHIVANSDDKTSVFTNAEIVESVNAANLDG
jgi:hypothetical protein